MTGPVSFAPDAEIAAQPFTFGLPPDPDAGEGPSMRVEGGAVELPAAIEGAWWLSQHRGAIVHVLDNRDVTFDQGPKLIARVGVEWFADPSDVRPGTPVRFVTNPPGLGVITMREATAPGVPRWREQTARDGDVGLYHGPHPTMGTDWHLVTVRLADDPDEHLVVPVHLDSFAVVI